MGGVIHTTMYINDVCELSFSMRGLQVSGRDGFGWAQAKPGIRLGTTTLADKLAIVNIGREFTRQPYNIVSHNCNKFCAFMARRLGVAGIPPEIEHQFEVVQSSTFLRLARLAERGSQFASRLLQIKNGRDD